MTRRLSIALLVLCVSWCVLFVGVIDESSGQSVSPCPGDCNDDGAVSVDELVLGVNVALGSMSITRCSNLDTDGNSAVTINELVAAVSAVLNGCDNGTLAVSSAKLCFAGFTGNELPTQTLTVQRATGRWVVATNDPRLTATPAEGEGPADIQVALQTAGLSDGSGAGQIRITDAAGSSATTQVELSLYSPGQTAGWKLQTVEPVGPDGQITSLALDSEGRPGIASYRADQVIDRQLRYSHWTGCRWVSESVEKHGFDASLAFDSGGQPHISFLGSHLGILRYARRVGMSWDIVTVDDQGRDGDAGDRSSLVLDAADLPHISYQLKFLPGNVFTYDLRYARFDGTAWTLETVDAERVTGWDTSLALNSTAEPRISYHMDPAALKYAEWLGDHWNIEDVDDGGRPSSLKLDSAGRPLIAHHDPGPTDHPLRFARRNDDGRWQVETVDHQGLRPVGGARAFVSLALDSSDLPHIAYVDFSTNTLKYASQSSGGGWRIDIIDEGPNLGDFTSLQIDKQDVAHISYLDLTRGILKYAQGPSTP